MNIYIYIYMHKVFYFSRKTDKKQILLLKEEEKRLKKCIKKALFNVPLKQFCLQISFENATIFIFVKNDSSQKLKVLPDRFYSEAFCLKNIIIIIRRYGNLHFTLICIQFYCVHLVRHIENHSIPIHFYWIFHILINYFTRLCQNFIHRNKSNRNNKLRFMSVKNEGIQ